jgi:hypothetical protein
MPIRKQVKFNKINMFSTHFLIFEGKSVNQSEVLYLRPFIPYHTGGKKDHDL